MENDQVNKLTPVELFTKENIVAEWLAVSKNELRLPIIRVDDPGYLRAIKDVAEVYNFGRDDIYYFNKNYFKIKE